MYAVHACDTRAIHKLLGNFFITLFIFNQSINNFINVSVRSSLHIRKLIGDTYLLVN